ncbi:MAG: hypothetical protein JF587_06860 [Catenulisporales bacterium]|nr:hypothetical protein [Catenulisporales bacterium]
MLSALSSLIEDLSRQLEDVVLPCGVAELPGLPTLLEDLADVPDPRAVCGRRFALPFLLAAAVLEVPAGARPIAAVARRHATADAAVVAALGGDPIRPAASAIGPGAASGSAPTRWMTPYSAGSTPSWPSAMSATRCS